jgi:hypothetical protein
MPTRPERTVADRYARQLLLASPLVFQGLFGFLCLILFPDIGYTGPVVAWVFCMGFCWWLPMRQRARARAKKAAARAALRAAKAARESAPPAGPVEGKARD